MAAGRYIPTDILSNILVRLSASSLQRLKYASKEWFHTISDPDFAEAHFTHQSQEEFGYNVLIGLNKEDIFIGERLPSDPNLPRRMNLPGVHGHACVHGSCKGLFLFQCGTSLHVANPITRDRLSLPQFCGYGGSIFNASIGCGCDGKLKVVVVGRRGRKILRSPLICGVLTLGSGSWREVHIPVIRSLSKPCWAGGALHWIYDTGILSLDLCEEKFHQTEVTFCNYTQLRYRSRYLEWDGCFAILVGQPLSTPHYWVWVLKESGWMKLVDIDVAFFECLGLSSIEDGPDFATTARNGKIILFLQLVKGGMQLFAYDMDCGTVTKFTEFGSNFFLPYLKQGYFCLSTHVDSMIPCSSLDLPKRIGVCDLAPKTVGVCDLATKFLAYSACTLRNLFKS